MCFSATASFVAGGALSAAGLATVTKATKRELPLASIPLLFGLQQLVDGAVWVTSETSKLHVIAVYAYAAFAFVFWPIFTPLAVLLVETQPLRKRILVVLLVVGAGLSAFLLNALVLNGADAHMLPSCIAYAIPHKYGTLSIFLYLLAVNGSFLVSSKKILRVFGITLLISFAIAGWFYEVTFSSTWCFFAAVLSGILFLYFQRDGS